MKILHVVPTYVPAWRYGGPIVAVHGLCRALVARGHEVDVFTTNVDGPQTLSVPTGAAHDVDGVQVHYFDAQFRRLYWSRGMKRALRHIGTYDVVHIHAVYLWPGVAAARAARRSGVPYLISPRGMLVPELVRARNRVVKSAWLRLIERRGFAGAASIHFTSALEMEDAKRVGLPLPSPVVIPNGVEAGAPPAVRRERDMLLFLGRITWKKGIEQVIDALPSLPGVRFVVAGNDEEHLVPRLQARAAVRGVAERVEFVGPVYGAAKDELLARATVFVLPSRSENFGNAVLEALAMQTPVVLSKGVGLADEVVAAGAGAIGIESLPSLLADPELRERMGTQGRALVESRFAWGRIAAEMEEAYRCSISLRR